MEPEHGTPNEQTIVLDTPDGRSLGVCQWGDPEGARMFWLHGTPGSRLLRHTGVGYLTHGLRVCTYDRPGYGLSTRAAGRKVADAAADVRAIADTLGWMEFGVAGVSGGASSALATAALLPDRVTRCAFVVGSAPFTTQDLDFFAGMDEEARDGWERSRQGDDAALESEWNEIVEWTEAGLPGVELTDEVKVMLSETVGEAGRQGSGGFVDDCLSEVRDWGFALEDIRAPTRIMLARDDTSVPAAHGEWLLRHVPSAELIWVDGGHFGPRDEPEMRLMAWVGHGQDPGP
jgi:pimeloyl-ACP methyl ester carboxylesterase